MRERIDEDVVKKTSSSTGVNQVIKQKQRQSRLSVPMLRQWSTRIECRRVKRGKPGQDQTSDVFGGNGREIEDVNEDCRSSRRCNSLTR